jgi:TldD protein
MLTKKLSKKILAAALAGGGDFAEIFFEDKKSNVLSLENSKLEKVKTGFNLGMGIRVLTNGQVSYAYTDDLSRDSLFTTAKAAGAASQKNKQLEVVDLTTKDVSNSHPIEISPDTVEKKEKAELVKEINQAALAYDDSVQQVKVDYIDYNQKIKIANSEGLFAEDERTRTRIRAHVIAGDGEQIQTGSESIGLHQGFELFKEHQPEEIGKEAARQASVMLRANPAPSGPMPVVINNSFGGVIFHEACGHGLEADAVQKGSSVFADKIGEEVASSKVTAIDDGSVKNAWGSFNIDDEGTSAQKTVLIEDGVLQNYMYDLRAARKEGVSSSGNGRRNSYRSVPVPRMTNTFIAPGEKEPEQIIGAVEEGLYAKKLSGGQVDPATGEFVFTVSEGYLINKGELAEPVRGATLVGKGIDVLKKISMIGNDLELAPGMCGKKGQKVPTSVGQPTLLVDEITVGGTERKGE